MSIPHNILDKIQFSLFSISVIRPLPFTSQSSASAEKWFYSSL